MQTFSQILANTPAQVTPTPQQVAANGNPVLPYAAAQRIDNLSNVTITSPTIVAPSISGLSTSQVSEGSNFYYTDARVGSYISGSSTVPHAGGTAYGDLLSWNGSNWTTRATSTLALNTDNLVEGSSNLFFTNNRVASVIAGTTTDALAQGTTHKYYATNLFATDLAGTSTDALREGTANLYFTNSRVATIIAGTTTSALAEGSNLYWTQGRFNSALLATSSVPSLSVGTSSVALSFYGFAPNSYLSLSDWYATTSLPNLTNIGTISNLNALNVTTTNFLATTASSTNLLATSASFGSLAGTAFSSLSPYYLPKWNSGTWANSLVYDNGTNIGIGTASPQNKLDVYGDVGLGNPKSDGQAIYLMSTFSNANSHNLFLLASGDGIHWADLGNGNPMYGTNSVRDPSIAYIGGIYWVAHTVTGGVAPAYEMGLASSTDGVNWMGGTFIDVSAVIGNGSSSYAWAPEWFTDSDGSVHIFFAGSSTCTSPCTNGTGFQLYETHPTNATYTTWSTPILVTGTGLSSNMIDPFVVKNGSTYYIWYKNEAVNYIEYMSSPSLTSGYTVVKGGNWAGWGISNEGPSLVQVNSSMWRIYFDYSPDHGIYYSQSTDNWNTWSTKAAVAAPFFTSHGTIIRLSTAQAVRTILGVSLSLGSSGQNNLYVSQKLGVGTASPAWPIDIVKAGISYGATNNTAIMRLTQTGVNNNEIAFGYDSSQSGDNQVVTISTPRNLAFDTYSPNAFAWGERMRLTALGQLGIGTTSPDMLLSVGSATPVGNIAHFENSTGSCYINPTTTSLSCSSDARLKNNINTLTASSGLAALLQLNPVTYNWNTEATGTPTHVGFIAQQVLPILPDLVSQGPDGYYTLNYAGFTPYLVKAVQEVASVSGVFEQNLVAWLGNAGNGIGDLFANNIRAKNELCVGSTCVTPAQFQAMVAAAVQAQQGNGGGSSAASAASSSAPDSPPIIQINGNNPAYISIGSTYQDLGATITGPTADLNLGITTFLNGTPMNPLTLDTSAAATDTIDYVVTDQSGLTATSTRTVIVEAPQTPDTSRTDATSTGE